MIKDDYIMRIIRDMVQVLVRVKRNKVEEDFEQADGDLHDALESLIGLDRATLVTMDVDQILELAYDPSHEDGYDRARWVARLLAESADVLSARADVETARETHVKAFCIFDELEKRGATLGEHEEYFGELLGRLD